MYRVLLVDDDKEVLHINGDYLKGKGFQICTAASAASALKKLEHFSPHCIVMDVMMPDIDGFEAFELIRKRSDAPILYLTAKTQQEDRIWGLTLGADDYIVKPCSLEELSLRIKINIRRQNKAGNEAGVLEFPPLRIELVAHKVFYNKEEILLSKREFELLVCLAKHPQEIMTFQQIGTELFGNYIDADRKNIMVSASRLRKKLEGYVGLENMIETAWGKGYCFKG